jgi:hypothetical protein
MTTDDTQKRYNPLFEGECSKLKSESEISAVVALAGIERQQASKAIITTSVQCLRCKAWIRSTWWSRLIHKLVCWMRR